MALPQHWSAQMRSTVNLIKHATLRQDFPNALVVESGRLRSQIS